MFEIDARALTYGAFVLVNPTVSPAWIPTGQVYSADLSPGTYGFQLMSGVGASFDFTVDAAGHVSYDPALTFLAGQGTSTLTVDGLAVSIDATKLWGGPTVLKNIVGAQPLTSGALRLLPGPHQFVYGSAQDADIVVTVTEAGTFDYADRFDVRSHGCLSGRGTPALTLVGYPIIIDARDSGATALQLANLTGEIEGFEGEVFLLPFDDYRFILQPAVVTDPAVYLSISDAGAPSISPLLAEHAMLDTSSTVPVLRFTSLPQPSPIVPLRASSLCAVALPDLTLTVLALDEAGTIHYSTQYDPFFNSYWSAFRPYGGRADAISCCQLLDDYEDYASPTSTVSVVWKVDSGQLAYRTLGGANAIWSAWNSWAPPPRAGRLHDIAVVALPGAAQGVVVLDDAGRLFSTTVSPSGIAGAWTALAPPPGRAAVSAVAATCDNTGRPVLLAATDTVYVTGKASDDAAATWLPWTAVPDAPPAATFTASALPSGAPLVLITSTSGQVFASHRARLGWSAWTPLTQFTGTVTAATAARCGDLNTAVWTASATGMEISWTAVPSDSAGWSPATVFDPQPPDTFDFGISNIDIEETRSGSLFGTAEDTDYAYVAVKVGSKPSIVVPLPDAPLNVKAGQYRGFGISNVPVAADEVVTFAYTFVNSGHGDPSEIDKALQSATQQLLETAADAVQDAVQEAAVDAITQAALAAISDAAIGELVGLAASAFVGPLLGLIAGWLEGQITGLLFADCDGAVASGVHITTGAILRAGSEAGQHGVDSNPGSDSPHGCGGKSLYNTSWFARPYRPDTSVTLDIGYPFNQHSTGVRTVDHKAWLKFQGDGNLVVLDENASPGWASGTDGVGARCVLQGDGNLVIYDADGGACWSSDTDNSTDRLVVQGDGNVVIYDAAGNVGWASNTNY